MTTKGFDYSKLTDEELENLRIRTKERLAEIEKELKIRKENTIKELQEQVKKLSVKDRIKSNRISTLLFDRSGAEIYFGDSVEILTDSTPNHPFRGVRIGIVIGLAHQGRRLKIGKVSDPTIITDREPRNVLVRKF